MKTQVTFRLLGESGGSAADVTRALGIAPDEAAEAGTPAGARTAAVRGWSIWMLRSGPRPTDGQELAAALHLVMDRLEPAKDALWELVEAGYWANWFCYLGSAALEHAAELDRSTLQRLLTLPGDLWLDVYPEDEE